MNALERQPHLHDKIEFEIVLTCLTFDFERRSIPLREAGFTDVEIEALKSALREITDSATKRRVNDNELLTQLSERYELIESSDKDPLDKAMLFLGDCKKLGTLPFAHMARTGFIAVEMLRSLESRGITSTDQTAAFLNSVPTIATKLQADANLVKLGELSWQAFVSRYGHLRPGTYDITIPSYSEDPEIYLRPLTLSESDNVPDASTIQYWDEQTRDSISKELSQFGFALTVEEFENFIRQSIQDREYAKFVFSKNLSAALDEFAKFGDLHEINREQLSYIDLSDLISMRDSGVMTQPEKISTIVEEGKAAHELSLRIELPPLINGPKDLELFELWDEEPNYVTVKRIQAEIVDGQSDRDGLADALDGRIVMIPNADPGFDWLLALPIAGLITMYGGANSHMTIRAAELSLPAAIGVGTRLYSSLLQAKVLDLDCESRRISVVL